MQYTEEQIEDIKEREQKGVDTLRELGLTVSAKLQWVNMGNNIFSTRVTPFLADTKYLLNESDQETEEPVATE